MSRCAVSSQLYDFCHLYMWVLYKENVWLIFGQTILSFWVTKFSGTFIFPIIIRWQWNELKCSIKCFKRPALNKVEDKDSLCLCVSTKEPQQHRALRAALLAISSQSSLSFDWTGSKKKERKDKEKSCIENGPRKLPPTLRTLYQLFSISWSLS